MTLNALRIVKSFERAGFNRENAEDLATELAEAISNSNLVSKTDLELATINLRQEMAEVKSELKEDIANVRTELAEVKSELKEDIACRS